MKTTGSLGACNREVPAFKADDVEGENAAREFISNTMKEVAARDSAIMPSATHAPHSP